jgi:hypothetical protein
MLVGRTQVQTTIMNYTLFAERELGAKHEQFSPMTTLLKMENKNAPFYRAFSFGWVKGLEPSTFCSTDRRSNQLSYTHQIKIIVA